MAEGEEGGDKSRIKSASSQGWQALKRVLPNIWCYNNTKAKVNFMKYLSD